jgi:dihydroflavonol-4-reductase
MTRILVTGGSGFLGQYLVRNLAHAGHDVSVIDLKPSLHVTNDIAAFCSSVRYGVDITKPDSLYGHLDGIDVVYHLAGLVSFWRRHENLLLQVNVHGTRNVLNEAMRAGVSRFVHVSSVAAIGCDETTDHDTLLDETFDMDFSRAAHKHYMLSKHLAEKEVRQAESKGLNTVIVNPGLMWGPGDVVNSYKLIHRLSLQKVFACVPGGTNIVDVRDVANGLQKFVSQGESGARYILGGHNISFREACGAIARVLNVPPPSHIMPRFLKPFLYVGAALYENLCAGQPAFTSDHVDSAFMFRYFSSRKAAREIGWRPTTTFESTIFDTVAWLRGQGMLEASC